VDQDNGTVNAASSRWRALASAEVDLGFQIGACAKLARRYGVPCQVLLEEFMACAVGGCATPPPTSAGPAMKRVCVDGHRIVMRRDTRARGLRSQTAKPRVAPHYPVPAVLGWISNA